MSDPYNPSDYVPLDTDRLTALGQAALDAEKLEQVLSVHPRVALRLVAAVVYEQKRAHLAERERDEAVSRWEKLVQSVVK